MNGRCAKVLNILISIGFVFLAAGLLLLFSDLLASSKFSVLAYLFIQAVLGGLIVCMGLKFTKRTYHIFSGSLICLYGLISSLFIFFDGISFFMVWPLYALFPAVSLVLCSCYKYKKIKINYGVPSFILFMMSLYYFLFSFDIIKISFSFVSYFVAPILIVGILVIFILFYFLQKRHKNLVLSEDDSDELSDEEFPDFE